MDPIKENDLVKVMGTTIEEYLNDINQGLQNGYIEEVNAIVKKLKKEIDKQVAQSIQDKEEKEKREKLKKEINEYIENATQKREEEIKRQKDEEEMLKLRGEIQTDNEKDADQWIRTVYYGIRQEQIITESELENEHKKIREEIGNDEKDLTKCNEIFSKLENGYKDLLVDDIFYQHIKEHLIEKYTAKDIEKALKGKKIPEIYKSIVKKCDTISQENKIKLIDRFKNIKERENLLQQEPYRIINSEIQLSVYFDMIESQYKGTLPKAYQKEKQHMIENYSEEKTYIMPKDLVSYFEEILNKYEQNKQFPEEYDNDKEVKELQIAIEQIQPKLENTEKAKQVIKRDKEEFIKEETPLPKNNIFRNIYENAKAKVVSVFSRFKKNKAQSFPIEYKKEDNKFKKNIEIGAPTQKEQAKNSKQYEEKYKTTTDRALSNMNSTINSNYTMR